MPRFQLIGYIIIALIFNISSGHAQNSAIDRPGTGLLATALDLYEKEQFSQSLVMLDDFIATHPTHPQRAQALAYAAVSALQLRQPEGKARVEQFLEEHNTSPYAQEAKLALGRYYFQEKEFKKSIEFLKDNIPLVPANLDQVRDVYILAYAYFQTGNQQQARHLFAGINRGLHQYAAPASYYSGYLAFKNSDYELALEDLSRASKVSEYKKETDVLIPSIYYQQGKYNKVAKFVKEYEDSGKPLPTGLKLLAGEVYFMAKEYGQAYDYLRDYVNEAQQAEDRKMFYRLGFSSLKVDNKDMAIKYLGKAADGDDDLAQVAAYHLGLTYISANKKDFADIAFNKARQLSHDLALQELSAYYYIKVNFDNKNYGNVVSGSQFYQQTFPEGEYLEEVYEFQSEALLNTGSYDKALEVLKAIKNKSMKVRSNIQLIAYNKGVKEYNDEQYKAAVSSLKLSTDYPVDKELQSNTNLWLGETYSLGNKFGMALVFYRKVQAQYTAYNDALYGMGYAHYNLKEYQKAQGYFQAYLQRPSNGRSEQRVDAFVRLGDCYYVAKDYNNAIAVYKSAESIPNAPMVYLLHQRARAYMGIGALNDAMRDLKQAAQNYPDSKDLDRVYYTMGELLFDNGRMEESIKWLTTFIETFNRHPQLADVYVKRAQGHQLLNQLEQAVSDCKMVIDNQPASGAAATAARIMIDIQNSGYAIAGFDLYKRKFMQANPQSSVAVESSFGMAVKPFNDEEFELATRTLHDFARQYPKSEFTGEAYYKLGLSHEYIGQHDEAISSYKKVSGAYQAKALKNAGDLEIEQGKYADAVTTFLDLKKTATSSRYDDFSTVGLMEAYLGINDFEASMRYADQIIKEEKGRYISLAYLFKGKSSEKQQQYDDAFQYYRMTTQMSKGKEGAEAQYLIGKVLRSQKKYENSTQELIQVRNNYEGYTNWIYNAFLLIAENYINIDNTFQAKATLQSIIDNSDDPSVIKQAEIRLAEIQ